MKVTVAGAGSGGYAAMAYFTMIGHDVTLFNRSESTLQPMKERGGVEVFGNTSLTEMQGFIEIDKSKITTDPKMAVEGAEIIVNPVPSIAYGWYAEQFSKYLKDGQIIYTFGKGGGSLQYAKKLKELGNTAKVYLGDCNTLFFGASKLGPPKYKPSTVRIEAPINRFLVGAFPAKDTDHIHDHVQQLFPKFELRKAKNAIDTLLADYNAMTHTPPMICNAARIDAGDQTYCLFGRDSLTKSVVNLVEDLDNERRAIGDKLGIPNNSLAEEIRLVGWNPRFGLYAKDPTEDTLPLWEAIHNEYLEICEGPYSLNVRMFTEDIPDGLLCYASLGNMLDVPTPISKAISTLASALLRIDFQKTARTVEQLGIDPNWTVGQVNKFLDEGHI